MDEAIAMTKQQRELLRYRKTHRFSSSLIRPRAGSRVLCLDGGGVRGLIQIEVASHFLLRIARVVLVNIRCYLSSPKCIVKGRSFWC